MIRTKLIFTLFAVIVSSIPCFARQSSASLIDSLRIELSKATVPADSLRILYDIYDLSPIGDCPKVIRELRHAAESCGDTGALLDIIRRSANSYAGDSMSSPYWDNLITQLPPSRERDETALYMKVQRAVFSVKKQNEQEHLSTIARLITEEESPHTDGINDNLEEISRLYTLIIYLATETNGHMLKDYIEQLGKLMEGIKLYALKNQYYTTAANSYTALGMEEKAVEADRQLLKCIDLLKEDMRKKGRKFRSYERNRYICYRRMLYNYKALSKDEIEHCYARLGQLTGESDDLAAVFSRDHYARAFYFTAKGEYENALGHIRSALEQPSMPITRRIKLLDMLRDACAATGDKSGEIKALSDYNDILAEYNEQDAAQKYRELQIKYDVHKLMAENASLELEKQDSRLRVTQISLLATGIGLVVIATFLLILFYSYRKAKSLSATLSQTVDTLERERDELKKVQKNYIDARDKAERANRAKDNFLHSMSHELRTPLNAILGFSHVIVRKMPAELKKTMAVYSSQIEKNAEQLENLIDDVLYLSTIGPDMPDFEPETVTVGEIFENTVNNQHHPRNGEVELRIDSSLCDIAITTDRKKVELILSKLLSNALKFTKAGFVELSAMLTPDSSGLRLIVTDSGCGIPADKKDEIFERFAKLDTFVPGAGLGLYIARQVAEMFGGSVTLDTSYTDGARFVLTIPYIKAMSTSPVGEFSAAAL